MFRVRPEGIALRLRRGAVRRGVVPPTGLDEDPVLALCGVVRTIPYGPPSVRRAEAVVDAWEGTSSGKHALLLAALQELGVQARAFLRTHRVSPEDAAAFGPAVAAIVPDEGLVDVHTWLAVAWRGRLRAVDVTFPAPPSGAAGEEGDHQGGGGGLPPVTLPMALSCGPGQDVALAAGQDLVAAADALAALRTDRMAREELLAAIARALSPER